jgi:hypothetical protein
MAQLLFTALADTAVPAAAAAAAVLALLFCPVQGNTPSDHFKRIQKFAAAANNRNLLQHSELGSILLQANLPTSKGQQATGPITTINNRKMLQLV